MRTFALFITSLVISQAQAQIDPTSPLLLNQGNRPASKDSGLDSGRYTTRPRSEGSSTQRREERKKNPTHATTGEEKVQTSPPPQNPGTAIEAASSDAAQPTVIENPKPGGFLSEGAQKVQQGDPSADGTTLTGPPAPTVSNVIMGGSDEQIDQYKQDLDPEDRRLNLIEISLAPTFIYNESRSSYFYRNYTTAGPGFHTEARVWFSPFFGVQGSYDASLGGNVKDSGASDRSVPATHSWLNVGIRGRRFLSTSERAPSLVFGIDFREYQMRVPSDAQVRGKLRTTGVAVTFDSEWPSSTTGSRYSWLLGAWLEPKARHKESGTTIDLRSGSNAETNAVGFSVGGRLHFDRGNSVYFKLSHEIEKNLFSGEASLPDPISGTTPTGVPVMQSFTVFQIGYTWGQ